MQNDHAKPASKSYSKFVPTLVLIVAILPIAASVFLYATDWRPAATVNHGDLIVPARALAADNPLRDIDGNAVNFANLHGQWNMLYFGPSSCPADCMRNLYRMRQIHIAQGKESDRVQRVFITTDNSAPPTMKGQLIDYEGMLIWTTDAATLSKIANNFGTDAAQLAQQHHIYLVDPMGNLIMRYAPDVDPAGLRKDLARLLKYSAAG